MNIKEILKDLADHGEEMYALVCKVTAIDGFVCECEPVNGDAPVLDVRLVADDSENKFVMMPRLNSLVMVSFINKNAGFVSLVSDVERVLYKNADTVFELTDKLLLQNGEEDLLKLMSDLIDAMITEKHLTNTGVSISLVPDSVTAYTDIKNRFKNLLKQV